ncbi:Mitochondrial inner membrane protein Mitofilin [Macleaya cordata]|uniref:Mitochondrial inner membrane protein Mitofilin n=1 Tax=Macleaya cordata TaxID=56857 RepID=A0A200PYP9_MACCD|nr:Mitochondrial inner membrane protein Mitofilin [Macleaya cordata]
MMRRCILEFSSGRSIRRVPRQAITQMPNFISSRREFSVRSNQNVPPSPSGSTGKPRESGSNFPKLLFGGVAIGAVGFAAYQAGYLGYPYSKEEKLSIESSNIDADDKVLKDTGDLGDKVGVENNQEPSKLSPNLVDVEKNDEAPSDIPSIQGDSYVTPQEDTIPVEQKDLPSFSLDSLVSDGQSTHPEVSSQDSLDKKEMGDSLASTELGQNEGTNDTPISQETETKKTSEEIESKATPPHHLTLEEITEASVVNDAEPPSSLLDAYSLQKDEGSPTTSFGGEVTDGSTSTPFSEEKEVLRSTGEELKDAYISKDGKLVLDFLEAIHAAEKKQADLDAHIFFEEKRMLKEKYEKELKDARARQLMYAEEAAILEKELNKERAKAAATIKLLQEKAEENLKMELERKEKEAELQLKKVQELAKAELAAAIASEKASQIEKMAEANLHINALCMAFYARSEEARQSHSVHKLALGALALEDALSKGLPIQTEIDALHTYLEGIDKDSLLDLVLSSLPEETLNHGIDTQLQLNQKFDALKDTLRHYSLIPPGGGGILAHTLAHIASGLKVREDDQSGDGIESVISRVERLLVEGKLAEAADALEGGVSGSKAEEIIGDWVKQARNRAITEQALSLLQSYATSISLT